MANQVGVRYEVAHYNSGRGVRPRTPDRQSDGHSLSAGSLERLAVHRRALDAGQVEVLQAADIDRDRRAGLGIVAEAERRAAAALAEAVFDDVLVEHVRAQLGVVGLEHEAFAWRECEQVAFT